MPENVGVFLPDMAPRHHPGNRRSTDTIALSHLFRPKKGNTDIFKVISIYTDLSHESCCALQLQCNGTPSGLFTARLRDFKAHRMGEYREIDTYAL